MASPLQWESEIIEIDPDFEEEKVIATFKFENTSDQPITITSTKTSCGCTVAELAKKDYEAGETGEIKAVFDVGQRVGLQQKQISVHLNGEADPAYNLTLKVNIPRAITLKPRVRTWKKGSDLEPQTIEVILHEKLDMEINGILPLNSDGSQFEISLEPGSQKRFYTITLLPRVSDKQLRGRFVLSSDSDTNGILKRFPIYAFLR
ncbi:DUF1573 domain-containing protein [Puniceicoccaceae bacterium K14]|nr:DUF1573 domain-containing protein [Puniceicoccaceae bacterium K14]